MATETEAKTAEQGNGQPKGTEKLVEKLRGALDQARERLETAKRDIDELRSQDEEHLRAKAGEIQQRIDSQRDRAVQVRDQVATWLSEKKEQGEEAVKSWRQKRQIRRLENRAERAEEYAVNALVVAMIDADDAEMAMLEAIQARLDADAAYQPANA